LKRGRTKHRVSILGADKANTTDGKTGGRGELISYQHWWTGNAAELWEIRQKKAQKPKKKTERQWELR